MSVILSGTVYGWDSEEFHEDLGMFVLSGILMGKGKILEGFGAFDEVGGKVSEVVGGVVSSLGDVLDW